MCGEKSFVDASGFEASVEERNGKWILTVHVPTSLSDSSVEPVTTERLGTPRITEERYENADGTPIDFTKDLLRNTRKGSVVAGPFAKLFAGKQSFTVWEL